MNEVWQRSKHGASRQTPTRIIVHSMGERIDGKSAADFLETIGLSAHALVAPDGTVIRCREDTEGAYHALDFNRHSLGIEFLVPGEHDYGSFLRAIRSPYVTAEAWAAGVAVVRRWIETWQIHRIDRHSDVDPARKKDPGEGFDWQAFLAAVR